MGNESTPIRFVDLFAGLGGFHVGLSKVRGIKTKCVFVSELDQRLLEIYKKNFPGLKPSSYAGDITEVSAEQIGKHEILCAGFPCQPFSKAGNQKGFDCERNGNLFEGHLMRVIRHHKPPLLLLENVPNLRKHDNGNTFKEITRLLRKEKYSTRAELLSPHQFGIPQIRSRLYIVASRVGKRLENFSWPKSNGKEPSIYDILEFKKNKELKIPPYMEAAVEIWGEFLEKFPEHEGLPGFPIWGMEFGATYPYKSPTPATCSYEQLHASHGTLGVSLKGMDRKEALLNVPTYATEKTFPFWKQNYIRHNRDLYNNNKSWIQGWMKQLRGLHPSHQKLEWNCGREERDIWKHLISFRPSGIRVKKTDFAPALVTISTQVPIIGKYKRFMSTRECLALQGLEKIKHLPDSPAQINKALGNAVNADIVAKIITQLLKASPPPSTLRRAKTSPMPPEDTTSQQLLSYG